MHERADFQVARLVGKVAELTVLARRITGAGFDGLRNLRIAMMRPYRI